MNPCRFARAYLGRDFVQALDNTGVFPAGFASPQPKSAPRKLRSTCELAIIEGFLLPTSAAGLTPGKGGGAKRPDKGRSQAAGVRVLSPSSFLPSTRKILGPAQRPHSYGLEYIQQRADDIRPYKQHIYPLEVWRWAIHESPLWTNINQVEILQRAVGTPAPTRKNYAR